MVTSNTFESIRRQITYVPSIGNSRLHYLWQFLIVLSCLRYNVVNKCKKDATNKKWKSVKFHICYFIIFKEYFIAFSSWSFLFVTITSFNYYFRAFSSRSNVLVSPDCTCFVIDKLLSLMINKDIYDSSR